MSIQTHSFNQEVLQYLRSVSLREPDILAKLREETLKLPNAIMQISPEQGQFMQLLIKLTGAKKILEIGVFTGYSTLSMALALPENGLIIACDINEDWTAMARKYWKEANVDHKIQLELKPALSTLEALTNEGQQDSFDLAFIDADKTAYVEYYEYCFKLIKPGGLILIDNTLWEGKVIDKYTQDKDTRAIQELNLKLSKDERIDISMLPIGDGLTLARKVIQ